MKEISEFPCNQCEAHQQLKEEFETSNTLNSNQHNSILISIDRMSGNIRWMKNIGGWVLVTMLGYYIVIGYYIFSNDYATNTEVDLVKKRIGEGEAQHFSNERFIHSMNGKLEILVDNIKKGK